MVAKMSGQKTEEKQDINSLKVSTQIYLSGKKKSNFIVDKYDRHHLNQEIKANITRNETYQHQMSSEVM